MTFELIAGVLTKITANDLRTNTKGNVQMELNRATCQACPKALLRGMNAESVRCASGAFTGGCDGCGAQADVLVSLRYDRCPLGYWI